ncbi:MAG TPA: SDR family NAD(P)-dependent oxidoreductase [Chitinophagaceae bacterium]
MTPGANRNIIIIGATQGIGLALAKLFIQNGDTVGITGRRVHLLDAIKGAHPTQVYTECFDVTGPDNIVHVESLITKMNGMDILIYNAGYGEISEHLEWAIERQTTLTNVNGFVEIVGFAFRYFETQKAGHIVATSSIAALFPNRLAPAYSASKSFASRYMDGLALRAARLRKKGVRILISDLLPGYISTKPLQTPRRFWEATPEKAASQIYRAIRRGRRRTYITRRWALIAFVVRLVPFFAWKKIA